MIQGRQTTAFRKRAPGAFPPWSWLYGPLLLIYLLNAPVFADEDGRPVHLLLSGDSTAYQEFETGFREVADAPLLEKLSVHIGEEAFPVSRANEKPSPYWIAVGMQSLRWSLREHQDPLIAAMVPATSLNRLMETHRDRPISGLYIDQHPLRHLRLIKQALPDAERVGIITAPNDGERRSIFDEAADRADLILRHHQVSDRDELIAAVRSLSREADALLIVPSQITRDSRNLRALLLQSFRGRLPVFAYSPGLVSAGSLMAIHSTPRTLGRETAEQLMTLRDIPPEQWPDPDYPHHLALSTNREVARSLGIRLPDQEVLKQTLFREDSPEP